MRAADIVGSSEWSECLNVDTRPSAQVHGPVSLFSSDEVMEPLIYLRHLVWVLINIFCVFGTTVLCCVWRIAASEVVVVAILLLTNVPFSYDVSVLSGHF